MNHVREWGGQWEGAKLDHVPDTPFWATVMKVGVD
jgi:hypothetical protein